LTKLNGVMKYLEGAGRVEVDHVRTFTDRLQRTYLCLYTQKTKGTSLNRQINVLPFGIVGRDVPLSTRAVSNCSPPLFRCESVAGV
jgi:hypothetical protein